MQKIRSEKKLSNTGQKAANDISVKTKKILQNAVSIALLLSVCCLFGTSCEANQKTESVRDDLTIHRTVKFENKNLNSPVSQSDQEIVELAVAEFHRLYNEQKFEEVYNLMDESAKQMRKKDEFTKLLEDFYTRLGKVKESTPLEVKTVPQKDFTTIEINCKTKYENKNRHEKFKWIIRDGIAKLYSYSHQPESFPLLNENKNI